RARHVDVRVLEAVVRERLRMVAAEHDRRADRLLQLLGHLLREGPEVGERAHRDEIRLEGPGALEESLVAIQPREVWGLEKEVVVEAGVEDQVDLVAVRLEHRHAVADTQVLDAPVVEEDAHRVEHHTPRRVLSSTFRRGDIRLHGLHGAAHGPVRRAAHGTRPPTTSSREYVDRTRSDCRFVAARRAAMLAYT